MTSDETERWVENLEGVDQLVRQRLSAAADELALAIHVARDAGASWDAIGSALRVSRQAVAQRYGPDNPER